MAEGIRIVPRPDLGWPGDAVVCVTDHARPLPAPRDGTPLEKLVEPCRSCGQRHFAKTYRVDVRRGSAIVSTTVWERLRNLADNPFVYANPVAKPPGQIITPYNTNGVRHEWVERHPVI